MKLFGDSIADELGLNPTQDALSPRQRQQESGGEQFDSNGQVLIGRDMSGKRPANPEEWAYGVSQIQVGTAKATAEKHGIPWDESKLKSDKDYNWKLGDLHMNDLKAKYGSEQLATAAYHSGEPTIDRMVARYGRNWSNWDFSGKPNLRNYMSKIYGGGGQVAGGTGGGGSSQMLDDLLNLGATDAERAALQGQGDFVVNPYDPAVRSTLRDQHQKATDRLSVADQLLEETAARSQELRNQDIANLENVVKVKRAFNAETRQELLESTRRMEPIWQRKRALVDRIEKLNTMNPLEKGLRSIFDPNYDRGSLEGRLRQADQQIEYMQDIDAERAGMRDKVAALAMDDYATSSKLIAAMTSSDAEDVRLALQSFSIASQQMGTTIDGLQAEATVVGAQQRARDDLLGGLTIGQANELVSQAEAGGGTVTVNGVNLRLGEIKTTRNALIDVEMKLKAAQQASQLNDIQFAETMRDEALKGMTPTQLQTIIRDGGMYNGQQFDLAKVEQQLRIRQAARETSANEASINSIPGQVGNMLRGISAGFNGHTARMLNVFGRVPEEWNAFSSRSAAQLKTLNEGLKAATANGTAAEYLAQQAPMIQTMMEEQTKQVDRYVKQWAGGNKDVEAVGRAWVTGTPLDTVAATRGLMHFARNGVPAGVKMDPVSTRMLAVTEQAMRQFDNPKAGTKLADLLKEDVSPKQREQQRVAYVQSIVRSAFGKQSAIQIADNLPEIAKVLNDPAARAFARVSPQVWRDAANHGDTNGWATTATTDGMNMSPSDFKAMMEGGENGALWKEKVKSLSGNQAQFSYWEKVLQVNQLKSALIYLDKAAGDDSYRPSTALRALLQSPRFRQAVEAQASGGQFSSFGGFLFGSLTGGQTSGMVDGYLRNMEQAASQHHQEIRSRKIEAVNELTNNPYERAKFILASVPGLAPSDEQLLLGVIKQQIGSGRQLAISAGNALNTVTFSDENNLAYTANLEIDSFIMNQKFDDPRLEQARRIAAKHWGTFAGPADKALRNYFKD